ncbi:MAG: hypothetical protein ACR2K3_01890 [Nocardioides sp.]
MFVLGLILIALGVLAIVAALVDSNGTASLLGTELNARTIFLLGVAAGAAILWGFTISKFGAKRSLRHRRESRRLQELSDKLDRADAGRREDDQGEGS